MFESTFRLVNLVAILLSMAAGCTVCAAGVLRAQGRCTACVSSGVVLLLLGLGVVVLEVVPCEPLGFFRQWHGKGIAFLLLAGLVLGDGTLDLAFAIGVASVGLLFICCRFVLSDPEPLLGTKHFYFYSSSASARPYVPPTLRRNNNKRGPDAAAAAGGKEIFVERVPAADAARIKAERQREMLNRPK